MGAQDVACAIDYDPIGRVSKEYIAYDGTCNTGAFIAAPGSQPAKLTTYEPSPLNRPMLTKKVPDANAVTMIYNNRDRLAFVQDGNLAAA